jgi:hypothetical protein
MKKYFTFLTVSLLLMSSSASAQGLKSILTKLNSVETRLDQLQTTQEKEIQVLGQKVVNLESNQNTSPDKSAIKSINSEFSELKTDLTNVTSNVSVLKDDVETLKENLKQSKSAEVSKELVDDLNEIIVRLDKKIETVTATQNETAPVTAEITEPKLKFSPYGYFKLDMTYDEARTNNGNYMFWVNDTGASGDKDSEFNMTSRQTRLGANLNYDGLEDVQVTAKFEMDFYGGGAENKNMPMMRHAYFKVDYGKYYLVAGQTSDIFSPLVPTTVNYTVLWNCGNIGYRHPQIQVGHTAKNGVKIAGAVSRNIPGDFDGDGNDDGEDSSMPTLQALISYANSNLNVGFSGHYGKMEYVDNAGDDSDYSSYSGNIHLSYIISKEVTVKGEAFSGKTLNQYLGGIGQGFDYVLDKEVETSGGWISATIKSGPKTSYNVGFGIDQPKKDTGQNFPARNVNQCVFGNVFTEIAHNTSLALEISQGTTGYYTASGDDKEITSLRAHTSLILKF